MRIDKTRIQENNEKDLKSHLEKFDFMSNLLEREGNNVPKIN